MSSQRICFVFLFFNSVHSLISIASTSPRRNGIMSTAQNAINIDDDDSVVDLTDDGKPPPKETKIGGESHAARSTSMGDFIPFRLYNTKQSMGSTQYAPRPGSTQKYFQTLRQTIGFEGCSNDRKFQWLIVANYLFDVHYFLQQTLPDILAFKRVVVFYGEGVDPRGIAYWQELLQGSGNTVEFVRLVPSDPPKSKTNPLDVKIPYGVHHTKMFLVGYDECDKSKQNWQSNIRVVVHTANMIQQDVEWKCQGLYSQDFPLKSDVGSIDQKGHTKPNNPYVKSGKKRGWPFEDDDPQPFEDDLVRYLESYRYSTRQAWCNASQTQTKTLSNKPMSLVNLVRLYDFSSAYAVLIPSVPGRHSGVNAKNFGYSKLQNAIKEHVLDHCNHSGSAEKNFSKPSAKPLHSPVICQFSSMGSLSTKWLHDFISAIDIHSTSEANTTSRKPESLLVDKIKLVWPTVEEIRTSIEGYQGGGSVPGTSKNVNRDILAPLYHRWSKPGAEFNRNDDPLRTAKNVPHIKTFLQLSSDSKDDPSIEWLCLTSHNLSKAAWGEYQNSTGSITKNLFIRHWELGVFISPATLTKQLLDDGGDCKCQKVRLCPYIGSNSNTKVDEADTFSTGKRDALIPLPYNVNLERYGNGDVPWTVDGGGKILPDIFGRISC